MKPHEQKNKVKTKGEKEGGRRTIKNQTEKGEKSNKTLRKKVKRGEEKKPQTKRQNNHNVLQIINADFFIYKIYNFLICTQFHPLILKD
jgi:hypothetical protein